MHPLDLEVGEAKFRERVAIILSGHRAYMRCFNRLDGPRNGRYGVNGLRVLREIADAQQGISPTRIGRSIGLTSDHVGHILRNLERQRWVEWTLEPFDARYRCYVATASGRIVAHDFQEDVLVAAAELIAPHTLWTQVQLATELSRIQELLQHWRG